MSTSKPLVRRVLSGLVLGGLLALNACSVGTVTASSRLAAGAGSGAGGNASGWESSPRNVETARIDPPVVDHGQSAGREPVVFRIEKDCWSCR